MGKTILYVDNRVKYVQSHRLPWLRGAQDAGFDVHVTTLTAGDGTPIEEAGFTYHCISDDSRSNNPISELRLIARLYGLYRQLQPDLIHHITLRCVLYGGVASIFMPRAAVVNGVTGLGYLFSSKSLKVRLLRAVVLGALRVLRRRDQVYLFQNPDDEKLFRRHNISMPSTGRVIKGSGVDVERFAAQPEPSGPPVILFPARMLWHKGVQEFVAAARRICGNGTEARFVMVGDTDPDNPSGVSADQLEAWENEGVIKWWGYQEDMVDVFARSHIVCLPSFYREGVPKVLIEAAACGRPIVTTNMPGCREIVQDEKNGLLVPPRDGRAVARALGHLIDDAERRREMGKKGRELVKEEFSIDHVVQSTLEVYKNTLADRRGGSAPIPNKTARI